MMTNLTLVQILQSLKIWMYDKRFADTFQKSHHLPDLFSWLWVRYNSYKSSNKPFHNSIFHNSTVDTVMVY